MTKLLIITVLGFNTIIIKFHHPHPTGKILVGTLRTLFKLLQKEL